MSDTIPTANDNFFNKNAGVIITGFFLIFGIWFTYYLSKDGSQLSSREKTETKAPDGTYTKRELEIYK